MRETRIKTAMAVLIGMCVAAAASAQEVRIERYAHFVTWYSQQRPGIIEHQWDEAAVFPIRRGPGAGEGYDSKDPDIIRQQNEDFLKYGITPLASWWGAEHFAGDAFLNVYLTVPSPVKIGILYEVTGLLTSGTQGRRTVYDFDDPGNAQKFVSDIRYLKDTYFGRYPERFATIDGRPIIFIWLSGLFVGDFAHAAAEVKDEVYIIGSEVSPYPPGKNTEEHLSVIRGLDAVSSYGIQFDDFHSGRLDAAFVGQNISAYRLWSRWLQVHAPDVELIVPLSFSANDTGIPERAPHSRPFISTYEEAYDAAEQYRAFLTEAYLGCAMTNVRVAVNITSYNEHVEGTSLEGWLRNPDILRPHPFSAGSMYLDVVVSVFGPAIASAPVGCRQ